MKQTRCRRPIPILCLILLATGCGYHTAGRNATRIPALQVLAVPTFTNKTQTYKVEQTLTSAVVRELLNRTHYKLEYTEDSSADATLHGTVVSTQVSPLTYDSASGRASSLVVTVIVKVSLVARDGRVLYENPNYTFRDQYQVARELSSFFEEESPALDRLSRDFARTLVSDMLEGF